MNTAPVTRDRGRAAASHARSGVEELPSAASASPWLHCGGARQRLLYLTTAVGTVERWAPDALLAATPGLDTTVADALCRLCDADAGTPIPPSLLVPALVRLLVLLGRPDADLAAGPRPPFDAPDADVQARDATAALVLLRDVLVARDVLPPAPTFATIEPTTAAVRRSPFTTITGGVSPRRPRERARLIATAVVGMAIATPPLLCWHRWPSVGALRVGRMLAVRTLDRPEDA